MGNSDYDGDGNRDANDGEEISYTDTSDGPSDHAENNTTTAQFIVNDVMISSASIDLQVRETIRSFDGIIRWYWLNRNDNPQPGEINTISALYSLDDDRLYTTGPNGNRALAGALLAPLFLTSGVSRDQRPQSVDTEIRQLPVESQSAPPERHQLPQQASAVTDQTLPAELRVSPRQHQHQP